MLAENCDTTKVAGPPVKGSVPNWKAVWGGKVSSVHHFNSQNCSSLQLLRASQEVSILLGKSWKRIEQILDTRWKVLVCLEVVKEILDISAETGDRTWNHKAEHLHPAILPFMPIQRVHERSATLTLPTADPIGWTFPYFAS
jgi:hypothetical protein